MNGVIIYYTQFTTHREERELNIFADKLLKNTHRSYYYFYFGRLSTLSSGKRLCGPILDMICTQKKITIAFWLGFGAVATTAAATAECSELKSNNFRLLNTKYRTAAAAAYSQKALVTANKIYYCNSYKKKKRKCNEKIEFRRLKMASERTTTQHVQMQIILFLWFTLMTLTVNLLFS